MTQTALYKKRRHKRGVAIAIAMSKRQQAIDEMGDDLLAPPDVSDLIHRNAAGDIFIDDTDYLWSCVYSSPLSSYWHNSNDKWQKPIFTRDFFESDYLFWERDYRERAKRRALESDAERAERHKKEWAEVNKEPPKYTFRELVADREKEQMAEFIAANPIKPPPEMPQEILKWLEMHGVKFGPQ